jgi:fibronectin-binding autotransporter adhesin
MPMNINQQTTNHFIFLKKTLKGVKLFSTRLRYLLAMTMVVFCAANIHAAQLIWDAGNTNDGPTIEPGSGGWDIDTTTNLNWNNGSGNVSWTQTSTTVGLNGAVFNGPAASAGTYLVELDGGQIAFTNLLINANGYVFDNDGNIANALYQPTTAFVQIADGVSVNITNYISGPGNGQLIWILGTGPTPATLNLFGRPGGGPGLCFSSTNGSTVYFGGAGSFSFTAGMNVNATVWITNGTYTYTVGGINVGRNVGPFAGKTPALAGTLIVDGPSTVVNLGTTGANAGFNIGQGTGQGKLIVQNGATFNTGVNAAGGVSGGFGTIAATYRGELDIYGGSFNIGNENTPSAANAITVMGGGCVPGCTFILNQTNGTFTSYGGIVLGGASGSFSGGFVAITNSGGFFNIGPGNGNGIKLGAVHPATNFITFSGGTVTTYGGSWSTALPITLATNNGNITFQCADTASGTPFNITLTGALSGPGGLNETGGGILTLGANNTYAGSTVVSNGTLVIKTATASTNGPVVLDGSAGNPVLSLTIGNSGQFWSIGGLTYAAGSPTADFNFGIISPSTTVAPIQSSGNIVFTATPNVTVEGTAIAVGTYPLIHYSGAVSGTLPTSPTFTGSASSGYITNITASQTIALVVTSSSYTSAISWRVGNGIWDINTTANWTRNAVASPYGDGDSVLFDDTASGTSPIAITLNATVNPGSVTANNPTKSYVISGTGTIAGSASMAVLGAGGLTLTGTNTYSGGTIVSSPGQLNINFGGDNSGANSAIGTGSLTLNTGAVLDNTSGRPVALIPSIPQFWNDDWTFIGSTNLSTGPGTVTMGNNLLNLTVVSNTLEVQGNIVDNGLGDKLIKSGNGALTLRTDNFFSGGFELVSGTVNIGSASSLGSGNVAIDGGAIDNVSGSDLTLAVSSPITWAGSFTFLGTGNLDFGSAPSAPITPSSALTVNIVSNTLTTEGDIVSGNSTLTKTGAGTWVVAGSGGGNALTVVVNQGELDLARTGNAAIGTGGAGANGASAGLTVQSGALAKITGTTGNQITDGKYIPVVLNSGGAFDMNGQNETVDLVSMTDGILRNGLSGSTSTLTVLQTAGSHPTNAITLNDVDCQFDVPATDAVLNVSAIVNGSGTLVKTGLGTVTLLESNNYTGNITVSNGILSLSFPDITNTATVTIATNSVLGTNAVLNLNFANSDTNMVAALVVGGVSKPAGLYSATTDPLYITGTGSLLVVPVINPVPGPIQFSLSGNTLALSWPANLGWILQSQTNALTVGVTTNNNAWFDVAGSGGVTSTNLTINPANPTVFFRLRHP